MDEEQRPRVGFVTPPKWFDTSPAEFLRIAPPGAAAMQTIVRLPGFAYRPQELVGAADALEAAASDLAEAGAQAVAQMGSLFATYAPGGLDGARRLARRIESRIGVPFVMNGLAMIDALEALGCASAAVTCTYYEQANAQSFFRLLEEAGIRIEARATFTSQGLFASQAEVDARGFAFPSEMALASIRRVAAAAPQAQAVVVTGAGVRLLDHARDLEAELQKPVIAADVAPHWALLQALRLTPRSRGFGRLLDQLGG